MKEEGMIVPVHNSLELIRGVDGNLYFLQTQTVEFPHGTQTQRIILSIEEMDRMVATYQSTKSASIAVEKVLNGEG
ncbi:hypothetical protein [Allocoleopsis franciscana]|uniref:Uncharacterized protein n=1 Tax=Allocoleopsis franciscana PCC 7113 TaxID=1173027 RepID=K9WS48_9CYAN|nr:hypothetical protein [Allocoleopsis franciscana]AFZ22382.1 hypothetical protein Mic7113_6825 [Allocoleopsis franciscana PCC 7113]